MAVLMIGYSGPLTRRLASSARPSPPDAWCAVGWRPQGQRSAQRKGSSGWPQMPAPVRRPKAEALSGGDREALAEALGEQARVRRSRVFCAASTNQPCCPPPTEIEGPVLKENPDKFGPNLTLTFNNMAEGLAMSESSSNVGRLEEAKKTAVEALQLMMPYFFERPPVFATRIATILKNYRRYARSLDRKPDERLVSPVVEFLHQLGVLID